MQFFIAPRNWLHSLKGRYRKSVRTRALMALSLQPVKKLIVGAGGTHFEGWTPTDKDVLNLLEAGDWNRFFQPDSLDAILAEHVWEHLTPGEAALAAEYCYKFLKPGGYLRIAVPDGFHPDPAYIDGVRPGGSGSGADDHKVLYTYKSFQDLFTGLGFKVSLLEYFDEHGNFHQSHWNAADGYIQRSMRFDARNAGGKPIYTSIILDARKP